LEGEYTSDIVGERAILLGAVHGIVESLYRWFVQRGMDSETAFVNSVESITGPISRTISRDGILAVYEQLDEQGKADFRHTYSATYGPAYALISEIYDEVTTNNEIRSVILACDRLPKQPMGTVE